MMKIGDFGPALAPVIASRVPVFAPSLRIVQESSWECVTPWGSVTVSGRIGGIHRRLLDAIFAYSLHPPRRNRNGSIDLLVDPYRIRKMVGGNGKGWIEKHLADLSDAWVIINGGAEGGSIVTDWQDSKMAAVFPNGITYARHGPRVVETNSRALLVVTIGAAWMRIYDHTLVVRYRNLLPLLHSIKSGAAYALALHVITHRNYNTRLDDALRHVLAIRDDMTDRAVRKVRAGVLGESNKLGEIGISITAGGIVKYSQHAAVRFASGVEDIDSEPILQVAEPISQAPELIFQDCQESLRVQRDVALLCAGDFQPCSTAPPVGREKGKK